MDRTKRFIITAFLSLFSLLPGDPGHSFYSYRPYRTEQEQQQSEGPSPFSFSVTGSRSSNFHMNIVRRNRELQRVEKTRIKVLAAS